MSDEFIFYKGFDSVSHDVAYVGRKSLDELKQLCLNNEQCIGFNTLGFFKDFICIESELKKVGFYTEENDGLYIHAGRYRKTRNSDQHIEFDNYTFYKDKDIVGNDLKTIKGASLVALKDEADNDPNCKGFNTSGTLKSKMEKECDMVSLKSMSSSDGLYVKKQKFRVKMLCNWCSCEQLCKEWNMMSKGDFRWNDIEVTWTDVDIDFYVIINKPCTNDKFIPSRTIVFQMEPYCDDPNQNWGVKTWGVWAIPDESKFLHVRTSKTHCNNCNWQLKTTYNDFKTMVINKTKGNLISSICSPKYFDPGHIKRIDFLKFIESKYESENISNNRVIVDIYTGSNPHKFKNYKGALVNKDDGIMQYKYYFMAENNKERNYITEKMWEPLLCECVCFYWGCPNIAEYIDPQAYIVLDLDDFEKSYEIVRNAILNDEWGKRLEVIRREKQKVLEYFNFFPSIERIIKHDFKFDYKPSDDTVLYHKYFRDILGQEVANVGFLHSRTIGGDTSILQEMLTRCSTSKLLDKLDYLYVINIGTPVNFDNLEISKIKVINFSTETQFDETLTINLLSLFCKHHNNCKILFLHTMGTNQQSPTTNVDCLNDWRNYMLYFMVEKHQVCMDMLNLYDTVGCNCTDGPNKYYNGNFWWANSNYIQTLNLLTSKNMFNQWLLSNEKVNPFTIYDTGVNHQMVLYPRDMYDNDTVNQMFDKYYKFDDKLRIKCINLVRRNDRKKRVEQSLMNVGLKDQCDFFEAVDGQLLQPTDELKKLFAGNDFHSLKGVIGCALSHKTLWEQLLVDPVYDKYLILEDDIKFVNGFQYKLNFLMDQSKDLKFVEGYDVMYLGCHVRNIYANKYNEKVKDVKFMKIMEYDTAITIGGLFGYVITKSGAQKFLKYIEENGIKHGIDYLMFRYDKEMDLKHYEVLPHIITSVYVGSVVGVDSDIQYDRNRLF